MKKMDVSRIDFRLVIVFYAALVFAIAFAGVFVSVITDDESNTHQTIELLSKPMPSYSLAMEPIEPADRGLLIVRDDEASVETVFESIVETEEVIEEERIMYFDIPLDQSIQDHIFKESERYGIDPTLVIAIIDKESDFRSHVIGDGGRSYGLMQIQARWHEDRMKALGCMDLLDPYQNITVGLDYLAELFESGKSIEWVLMAYNGGRSYANYNESHKVVSQYTYDVLQNIESLNKE